MEEQLFFFQYDTLPKNAFRKIRDSASLGPWQNPSERMINQYKHQKKIAWENNRCKEKDSQTELKTHITNKTKSQHFSQKKQAISKLKRKSTCPDQSTTKLLWIFKKNLQPTIIQDCSIVAQNQSSFYYLQKKNKMRKYSKQSIKEQYLLKGQSKSLRHKTTSNTNRQTSKKGFKITVDRNNTIINKLVMQKKSEQKNRMVQKFLKKRKNPKFENDIQPKFKQGRTHCQLSYSNILKHGLFEKFHGEQSQQKASQTIRFPVSPSVKKQKDSVFRQFYKRVKSCKMNVNFKNHLVNQL